jgi:hypothetical protein
MLAVLACNLIKAICIFLVLRKQPAVLLKIGDEMASFLQGQDEATTALGIRKEVPWNGFPH